MTADMTLILDRADMLSYSMAFGGGRLLDELTARNATNFSVKARQKLRE